VVQRIMGGSSFIELSTHFLLSILLRHNHKQQNILTKRSKLYIMNQSPQYTFPTTAIKFVFRFSNQNFKEWEVGNDITFFLTAPSSLVTIENFVNVPEPPLSSTEVQCLEGEIRAFMREQALQYEDKLFGLGSWQCGVCFKNANCFYHGLLNVLYQGPKLPFSKAPAILDFVTPLCMAFSPCYYAVQNETNFVLGRREKLQPSHLNTED